MVAEMTGDISHGSRATAARLLEDDAKNASDPSTFGVALLSMLVAGGQLAVGFLQETTSSDRRAHGEPWNSNQVTPSTTMSYRSPY